jgi:two-component system OmpR family response regulator
MKIIIAEDDLEVSKSLNSYLADSYYDVTCVSNGEELLKHIKKDKTYDFIISDVNMPILNGIDACKKIRQFSDIPIIILSSCRSELDRVIGLEIGADDYITKPFSQRELLARIKTVSKRYHMDIDKDNCIYPEYSFLGWKLKTLDRSLINSNGQEVIISSGLYSLVLAFAQNPNRILSRDQLMNLAKSRTNEVYDRTIDVQVGRIRQIFKDFPNLIKTVRSEGYIFTQEVVVK